MHALRRSQSVWLRSAPRFGFGYDTDWKEYLEYLEMDPSFIRSISDEPVWTAVETRMKSGENIWRDLIRDFKLLEVPYATASMPSPQLMRQIEDERKVRIADKLAREVQEDLTTGPSETIADLRELQRIAINRSALKIDLTLDRANLGKIGPTLGDFLDSIPDSADHARPDSENLPENNPLLANLMQRYNLRTSDFPWYVGYEDSRGTTASMVFYADFPGYSHLDHKSLVQQLSSNLGPVSLKRTR